jgi:hypothetical protein
VSKVVKEKIVVRLAFFCHVHNLSARFDELDPRTTKCVFSVISKPKKNVAIAFTTVDIIFYESTPYFLDECRLPLPPN